VRIGERAIMDILEGWGLVMASHLGV